MNAAQDSYAARNLRSLITMLAASVLTLPLASTAWAEIPAGPEAPSSKAYIALETEFGKRTILEPYLSRRAEQDAKQVGEDPGEQFLRLWIDAAAVGLHDADLEPVAAKGKEALKAGCDDPMVSYCYGRLLRQHDELQPSAKHLQLALENLESAGYDVSYCCWAASHLAGVLRDLRKHDEAAPLVGRELEYLKKTVAEGPYHPNEQRLLFQHIEWQLEYHPLEQMRALIEEIDEHLYPWLKHMAAAELDVREAWMARGGGWANEVSEEGWKGFAKHLASAREHLNEAWKLNPTWPESAANMITVAMAGHAEDEESPRLWFDRAVAAQFDYKPAYTALMNSLLPRWGGSHEQLYALGRECLATQRFDTQVPYYFLEAFEYIVKDIGSNLEYYKTPGLYEELLAMADGYLAEPTMSRHHDWYRSFKVAAAVRCGNWDDAHKFLAALSGEPHENAFRRLGLDPDAVIGEIYARSGELAEQNDEAERLAAAGKFEESRSKYEALIAKTADQKRVTTYFRGRMLGVEFERDFASGDWTPLPLDERLTGWRNLGGRWTVDRHGRLLGEAQTDGLLLMYEKPLGTRFELRGEMLVAKHTNSGCNLGVYFGQENGLLPNSFRVFLDDDYAAVLNHNDPLAQTATPVENVTTFRVARWDNAITAYVNDELVAEAVELEPYGAPQSEVLAVGGSYWYDGPILRFENLEIRQLNAPPGGGAEAPAAEAEGQGTSEEDPSL